MSATNTRSEGRLRYFSGLPGRFGSWATRQAVGCSLLLCFLVGCQPAKDTFLKDVALNYTSQGFLSASVFQVRCNSYTRFRGEVDDITPIRKRFLEICRLEMVKALARYKIRYDLHVEDKLASTIDRVKRTRFVQVNFTYDQLMRLKKTYKNYLPGYLVSESQEADLLLGTYRISKDDLIKDIQDLELPFKISFENS